jgi:hypothetical protein
MLANRDKVDGPGRRASESFWAERRAIVATADESNRHYRADEGTIRLMDNREPVHNDTLCWPTFRVGHLARRPASVGRQLSERTGYYQARAGRSPELVSA